MAKVKTGLHRHVTRRWSAGVAALLVGLSSAIVLPIVSRTAQADPPPAPVAEFIAPSCEGTTNDDPTNATGPIPNLLRVFGQRLVNYNNGSPVVLYNSQGQNGNSNPLCMVRYEAATGGPVSDWAYCTQDAALICATQDADGNIVRDGQIRPPLAWVPPYDEPIPAWGPYPEVSAADREKLQAYIVNNDMVLQRVDGTPVDSSNDSYDSRSVRQWLIHCIDNPDRTGTNPYQAGFPNTWEFCQVNMSQERRESILAVVNGALAAELDATTPGTGVSPGTEGRVTVTTTLLGTPLDVTASAGTWSLCPDAPATVTATGSTVTIAGTAVAPVTFDLCVTRPSPGVLSVTLTGAPPIVQAAGFAQSRTSPTENLCQIFALYNTRQPADLVTSAAINFGIRKPPMIATTLVDDVDGDKNIAQAGGTVTDTVDYDYLDPNSEYTVTGELVDKATGTPTGITGSTTFTSSATGAGAVEVPFTISDAWAGHTLVAFEILYQGDAEVAGHENINDAAQTVYIADIATTLVDDLDGDKNIVQAGGTVTDTITYENLAPNTEYTVTGELVDKATGEATGITGTKTFTSSATGNGTVDVEFTITDEWAGHTLVAFETLTQGDTEVATHEDINDAAQTVYIADIATTLVDDLDGDKNIAATGGTVTDTISYQNLLPNTEYTASGELVDKATGEGTGIIGTKTFTSSATGNGTVEVQFTITEEWAGHTLVAFETLTHGDDTIATHEDINDTAQTVTVGKTPSVATTLVDDVDGDKNVAQAGGTVTDTITYENLVSDTEYTVTGELVDKATGTKTGITGSTTFTSSATGNGTVDVEFTITDEWAGHTLVAFETLTQGDTEVATHEDINDTAQTVYIADIATTLVDDLDGDKNIAQTGGTVTDTITFENLAPTSEYTVTGELVDKATGTKTGITGSTTFTSSATGNGTVDVQFTITEEWAGHTLVAFETLTQGDTEVATHEDINDAAQTVYIADIATTLVDDLDGDKNIAATGGTVTDTITYQNLLPNTEYTASGELVDKATGEGTGITGSKTFTSSATGNGTVEVQFTITDEWAGHTLVAFETLTHGSDVIATHEDINDTAQTVHVGAAPRISTTLVDALDGDKNIAATGGAVTDTITYENLVSDTEYTVTGELVDKATGTKTGITGSTTFTSSATGNGTVDVEFTITDQWAGHTLVAFEILTLGEDQVATHEDINDRAQTVYVIEVDPTNSTGPSTSATPLSPTPAEASNTSTVPSSAGALPTDAGNTPPGSGYLPSTGVSSTTGPMAITAILALMCGTGLLLWGRTRTSRQH